MKKLIILFTISVSLASLAAPIRSNKFNPNKDGEHRLESVTTNANGNIVRRYKKGGRKEIIIPEATTNAITIVVTNTEGKVVNAYLKKIPSTRRSITKSSLLRADPEVTGNATNYVLYVKPINYYKYKPEHIDHYAETTNTVNTTELLQSKAKLLRADGDSANTNAAKSIEERISILEDKIATNKVLLAEAEAAGNTEEVERLTKIINRQEKTLKRLYSILTGSIDGGFYYMKDGTVVTYRLAVNYGFGGEPTNDIMRACYNSITNDSHSIWSVRKRYEENPQHDAHKVSIENPKANPHGRRRIIK